MIPEEKIKAIITKHDSIEKEIGTQSRTAIPVAQCPRILAKHQGDIGTSPRD